MFCCVLHFVFHILILLYHTSIFSILSGWRLSLLINDNITAEMMDGDITKEDLDNVDTLLQSRRNNNQIVVITCRKMKNYPTQQRGMSSEKNRSQ